MIRTRFRLHTNEPKWGAMMNRRALPLHQIGRVGIEKMNLDEKIDPARPPPGGIAEKFVGRFIFALGSLSSTISHSC